MFKPSYRPRKVSYEIGFVHLLLINYQALLLAGALLEGHGFGGCLPGNSGDIILNYVFQGHEYAWHTI